MDFVDLAGGVEPETLADTVEPFLDLLGLGGGRAVSIGSSSNMDSRSERSDEEGLVIREAFGAAESLVERLGAILLESLGRGRMMYDVGGRKKVE